MILTARVLSSLYLGCYQLSMLPNNVRLRVAFAISGNNLQQKLRLLLIPGQASRKLVNQNYTLFSMVINNCNSIGNNCGSRIIMSLRQLLCWAAGNCKNP